MRIAAGVDDSLPKFFLEIQSTSVLRCDFGNAYNYNIGIGDMILFEILNLALGSL